ncbi:tRNA pseudouridine(55) synthase TruB [soil metagenome]
MATGLLVLGIGRATRLLTFLVGMDKTYTATIRLGEATNTDDADGEITSSADATAVTRAAIVQAAAGLTGDITQVPSAVSAIKVNGQRAYARVRAGEEVRLAGRPVTVRSFDIHNVRPAGAASQASCDVDVTVEVSTGTYVRALARDLGGLLGVGGHLVALRRTSVGPLSVTRARTLVQIEASGDPEVVDMAAAAGEFFPTRTLAAEQVQALRYGQRIASAVPGRTDLVAAIGPDGDLVAMVDESGEQARSRVVFPAG